MVIYSLLLTSIALASEGYNLTINTLELAANESKTNKEKLNNYCQNHYGMMPRLAPGSTIISCQNITGRWARGTPGSFDTFENGNIISTYFVYDLGHAHMYEYDQIERIKSLKIIQGSNEITLIPDYSSPENCMYVNVYMPLLNETASMTGEKIILSINEWTKLLNNYYQDKGQFTHDMIRFANGMFISAEVREGFVEYIRKNLEANYKDKTEQKNAVQKRSITKKTIKSSK